MHQFHYSVQNNNVFSTKILLLFYPLSPHTLPLSPFPPLLQVHINHKSISSIASIFFSLLFLSFHLIFLSPVFIFSPASLVGNYNREDAHYKIYSRLFSLHSKIFIASSTSTLEAQLLHWVITVPSKFKSFISCCEYHSCNVLAGIQLAIKPQQVLSLIWDEAVVCPLYYINSVNRTRRGLLKVRRMNWRKTLNALWLLSIYSTCYLMPFTPSCLSCICHGLFTLLEVMNFAASGKYAA